MWAVCLWPVSTPAMPPNEEALDIKEFVFEHIGNAYEWHLFTWKETAISLPLPVIVRSKATGWHVFSSSRLRHGAVYNRLYIAGEGKYKNKIVEQNPAGEEIRPLDISFTKNALALFVNGALLLIIILPLARWYRRRGIKAVPKGFMGAVEMVIEYVLDEIIKPCVGHDYKRFAPYLLTVFFFILLTNLMGLVPFFPGGVNLTGNITITLFLALCTFLAINLTGTREYWKEILWPEVPLWLKVPLPIMPVIEFFGLFTKPFALMIRLFANITAGHAIILSLVCVIFITASMGAAVNAGMSVVAMLFAVFMNALECLVAFIQAYVFTLLSAVFIGMARVRTHGN